MSEKFDLAVIGSGPGGARAAIQAAKVGKRVVVVDKSGAGGGCAFFGTVPSKALREAALEAGKEGFPRAMERMHSVVAAESKIVAKQLERNGVTFARGAARFLSPFQLAVESAGNRLEIQADHFVIATGTSPIERPEFPLAAGSVHDSDTILGLRTLPKKILVLGAGVIGCEYSSIFHALGAEVTLADRRQELLRGVDLEAVSALQSHFAAERISLLLGAEFGRLELTGSASVKITLSGREWVGDCVLVCLGRAANTATLGLEKIGVQLDERGQIKVDPATYRSSQPHICAVGDVIGPPALAAAAAEQGRIAASRLFDIPAEPFPAHFPSGIYTIPEISSYGRLEAELRSMRVPFVTGKAHFRELARGLINGEVNGFLKLLVNSENRQLLGVHAFGAGASELIHIGQIAHALGANVDFLVRNVFNYPTYAEAYKVAALHALNQLRGN
jgi:NAD(P) transhydrogenase